MIYGADTDELRRLAQAFSAAADNLRVTNGRLTSTVDQTGWRGADAEQLKGRWKSTNRVKVDAAANELDRAAESLRANAAEQDRVSGSADGIATATVTAGIQGGISLGSAASWSPAVAFSLLDGIVGVNDLLQLFDTIEGEISGSIDLIRMAAGEAVSTSIGSVVVGGAVAGTDYLVNAAQYGLGSSEAAASAFDGTLSTVASIVPGGGFAYSAGNAIGQEMWDAGLGDQIMADSSINQYIGDIETIQSRTDAALAQGDFETATELSNLAMQEASRANEASSGFTGLWNSTKDVGSSLWPL